ncbi:MAG: glycosyl transferase, family 2 [Bryobacterales bacterium]|nr:glycosyl transferase, family 2 [Bryobacterales bacterium]
MVPAYNEAARLPLTLPKLAQFCERHGSVEVLIVDDGSKDSTAALIQEFAARHPFARLLQNPGNRGKGYSVRHGMQKAKGDWILSTDADLSSPLDEVHKLLAAVEREQAVAAIGSRALDRSLVGIHQAALREWSGRVFNLVMRAATGLPFRDTQCGFKLFRKDAARIIFPRQRLEGFGFDVEDLLIARIHGFKVVEVPVRWDDVKGTKVSTLTGARAFWDLLVVRWNQLCGNYR